MRNVEYRQVETEKAISKFRALVYQCRVCTFCAVADSGEVITKPLYTAGVDEAGDLFFYFKDDVPGFEQINWNNNIHLLYTNNARRVHMEVTGKSVVIMDKQKVRDFWNPLLNAYFPAGSHAMKFMKVHVTRVTLCNDFHGSKEVLLHDTPAGNLQVEVVKKTALLMVG